MNVSNIALSELVRGNFKFSFIIPSRDLSMFAFIFKDQLSLYMIFRAAV